MNRNVSIKKRHSARVSYSLSTICLLQLKCNTRNQRRIFIFGALGYFKLGSLLEGLRPLMSYKLSLHVLVTFAEQVVPINKHVAYYFILNSLDISNKNSDNET